MALLLLSQCMKKVCIRALSSCVVSTWRLAGCRNKVSAEIWFGRRMHAGGVIVVKRNQKKCHLTSDSADTAACTSATARSRHGRMCRRRCRRR